MKVIGIIGWKDTGKTTLIEKLINEFNNRNFSVSTIKHSHHRISVDKEGTDSFRHFNAGARETILASKKNCIKFSRELGKRGSSLSNIIKQIIPVDLVIVEGFKMEDHKKIEVVNGMSHRQPLFETDKTICGLIFNQHKIENTVLPQFERDNIEKICDFMVKTLEGE